MVNSITDFFRGIVAASLLLTAVMGGHAHSAELPSTIATGQLSMTGVDPQAKIPITLPKYIQAGELKMTGIDSMPKSSSPALPQTILTGELRMTGKY